MDFKIIILIIITILSLIFGSIVSYATIIKNRKLYSILKVFPLLFLIIGFVICYPTKPILYLALNSPVRSQVESPIIANLFICKISFFRGYRRV